MIDARVGVQGGQVSTTLGRARAHDGPMEERLRAVILRIAETGMVSCEVVGVVPCLHEVDFPHQTYQVGPTWTVSWTSSTRGR